MQPLLQGLSPSSRARVAFVIDTIENPEAGTEKQLLTLLERLDTGKIQPLLCCLYKSDWLKRHFPAYEIYEIGFRSYTDPHCWARLLKFSRFLRTGGFDIVHTFFRDGAIIGTLAARLAGVRTVVAARRNKGYWIDHRELLLIRLTNLGVSRFLANSNDVAEYTSQLEHVSPTRIDVIRNGVDAAVFGSNTERTRMRHALGLDESAVAIVSVANLRPVKGIDIFLRAMVLLSAKYPEAVAIVVGEGPERGSLEDLRLRLGLSESVHFLGRREDVPALLAASDIGVLASHSESMSNAILEYMAAGLPVVATNVGGAPELVEEGVNGTLVPAADPESLSQGLAMLLENRQNRFKMGEYSQELAKRKFGLRRFVQEHEDYYMGLIDG